MGLFDIFHAITKAYLEQTAPVMPASASKNAPQKQSDVPSEENDTVPESEPVLAQNTDSAAKEQAETEHSEIYIADDKWNAPEPVEAIVLSEREAAAQGWRFKKKSRKHAAIKRYTGNQRDLIIPSMIGEYTVNELQACAFAQSNIDSIRIPFTVKKLGSDCFRQSFIKKIVIAADVLEIPPRFAFSCMHLKEVQLPESLSTIRFCAFENCKALKNIMLPYCCTRVETWAFKNSGLTSLSVRYVQHFDGTSLENTPLDQHYQIIAVKGFHTDIHILLIGKNAQKVKLPKESYSFCSHSVLNRGKPLVLDCSQSKRPMFVYSAVQYSYSMYYGTPSLSAPLKIIVPTEMKNSCYHYYFADCVDAEYADGTPYEPFLKEISRSGDSAEYQLRIYSLPTGAFRQHDRSVMIHSKDSAGITIDKEAVCSRELEKIVFYGKLYGEGPIFHACCDNLHEVEWNGCRIFIPSAEVAGETAHKYLLNAFCSPKSVSRSKECCMFDSRMVDCLFMKQDNKVHQLSHSEWMNGHRNKRSIPVLKQRQKIALAADVLRSSEALFPNRDMYRNYLLTHRRYAMLLCNTLPQDYCDFLHSFYDVKQ